MTGAPYRPAEDLRLDIAARDALGTETGGTVEALLALNPGLAAAGGYVRAGEPLATPAATARRPVLAAVNPWE